MRRLGSSVSVMLIALFVLPFTAPFPTCDLGEWLGLTPLHHSLSQPAQSSALEDGTYSVLPTLSTEPGRLRLSVVTIASVPDPLPLLPLTFEPVRGVATRPPVEQARRQTVLRV
jgi:hypothetical protein